MFLFGAQILHIRLEFKVTLDSAAKLKAIKQKTNAQLAISLMNFDNLMLYDLMMGLYMFIPFHLILLF